MSLSPYMTDFTVDGYRCCNTYFCWLSSQLSSAVCSSLETASCTPHHTCISSPSSLLSHASFHVHAPWTLAADINVYVCLNQKKTFPECFKKNVFYYFFAIHGFNSINKARCIYISKTKIFFPTILLINIYIHRLHWPKIGYLSFNTSNLHSKTI